MQPAELWNLLEGKEDAWRAEDRRRAYFVSWLVNVQIRDKISANEIYNGLWPED